MRTGRPKQPSVLSDDKRNRVGLETGGRTAASTSARKSLAGLESRCTVVQTNRRIRPDQILVGHSACRYPTKRNWCTWPNTAGSSSEIPRN